MSASDYKELEARLRDGRWSLSIPVEVEDDYNGDTYWSERREHSDDPIHAADAIADLRSRLAEAEKDNTLFDHMTTLLAEERDALRHDLERAVAESARLREVIYAADRLYDSTVPALNGNDPRGRQAQIDYHDARAALGDSHERG